MYLNNYSQLRHVLLSRRLSYLCLYLLTCKLISPVWNFPPNYIPCSLGLVLCKFWNIPIVKTLKFCTLAFLLAIVTDAISVSFPKPTLYLLDIFNVQPWLTRYPPSNDLNVPKTVNSLNFECLQNFKLPLILTLTDVLQASFLFVSFYPRWSLSIAVALAGYDFQMWYLVSHNQPNSSSV
jgi:hypothetical protein